MGARPLWPALLTKDPGCFFKELQVSAMAGSSGRDDDASYIRELEDRLRETEYELEQSREQLLCARHEVQVIAKQLKAAYRVPKKTQGAPVLSIIHFNDARPAGI